MTRISFEGFNNKYLTFVAEDTLTAGKPVSFDDGESCTEALEGDYVAGICTEVRNGFATVLVQGYAEIKYSGTAPGFGYERFVCNALGGVCLADSNDNGPLFRVVKVDPEKKIVGFIF